jgi:hypothetical protein
MHQASSYCCNSDKVLKSTVFTISVMTSIRTVLGSSDRVWKSFHDLVPGLFCPYTARDCVCMVHSTFTFHHRSLFCCFFFSLVSCESCWKVVSILSFSSPLAYFSNCIDLPRQVCPIVPLVRRQCLPLPEQYVSHTPVPCHADNP